jgi:hypothetical protein
MKIRRILVIVVPILILFIVLVYIYLGGFKKPNINVKESQGYIVYGKHYKGKMDDKELKATYKEIQERYDAGELKGTFTVLHFHEPDQKGTVDAAVGIIVEDSTKAKEKGYGYFVWKRGPVAEVKIESHIAVSPSPQEIIEFVEGLAKGKGYKIGEGSLEKYFSKSHLEVEMPLIKKDK